MHRRDFFRAGGASLFGMSMADFFRARAAAPGKPGSKAKHMILIWMAGGPPHQDMFDMKVGSSRVDLQACKLEYSIVSPK